MSRKLWNNDIAQGAIKFVIKGFYLRDNEFLGQILFDGK